MDSDVEVGEEWELVDQQQLLADDTAQEDPAAAADAEEDAGFLVYLNEDEGGGKGKRQLTRRPTYSREERQAALLVHRAHALCLLAMGSLDDAAAGDPMLQAVLLSRLDARLATAASAAAHSSTTPQQQPAPAPDTSLLWLQQLVGWLRSNFRLQPPSNSGQTTTTSSSRDPLSLTGPGRGQVLLEAAGAGGGDEEVAVVLLVALLRSLGHLARLVRNLDVLPMKPGSGADSAGSLPPPRSLPRSATAPAAAAAARKQLGLSAKRQRRCRLAALAAAEEAGGGGMGGGSSHGNTPAAAASANGGRKRRKTTTTGAADSDAGKPPAVAAADGEGDCGGAKGGGAGQAGSKRALRGDEEFERELEMALAATAAEAAARGAVAAAGAGIRLGAGPSSSSGSRGRPPLGTSSSAPPLNGSPLPAAAATGWAGSSSGDGHSSAAVWSKIDQSTLVNGYSWSAAGRCTPRTWAEVYCGSSTAGRWVAVDLVRGWVDCADRLEGAAAARQPLRYVVAFQGGTPKDVTRRYVSSFPAVAKQRDEAWWCATMAALRQAGRHMPAAMAAAAASEANGCHPEGAAGAAVVDEAGTSHVGLAPAPKQQQQVVKPSAPHNAPTTTKAPPSVPSAPPAQPHPGLNPTSEDQLRLAREEAELASRAAAQAAALPTTIDAFKQHPLYVLERHITKYCALVPGAKPLGAHKGEPFFSKVDVQELHTAERWRREGRDVRPEELPQPAKVVKKRPQPPKRPAPPQPFWRRRAAGGGSSSAGGQPGGGGAEEEDPAEGAADEEGPAGDLPPTSITSSTNQEIQLYGRWQTDPWTPPAAVGGKVPKNSRGNVEVPPLAQALPAGTVHLQLPGVGGVCRRLGVDYAPALSGFEVQGGRSVPKIDGVVVCEEFAAQVTTAYLEQEEQKAARAAAARETAAAEAWRGLLTTMWTKITLVRRYAHKGGLLPPGHQQQQQQQGEEGKEQAAAAAAARAQDGLGIADDGGDDSDEEVANLAAAAGAAAKAGVAGGRTAADILKQHYHNEAPGTPAAGDGSQEAAAGGRGGRSRGGARSQQGRRKAPRHLLQEAAQLAEQGKVPRAPAAAAATAATAGEEEEGGPRAVTGSGAAGRGKREQEDPGGDDMHPEYEEF